jgi:hypothetical protein
MAARAAAARQLEENVVIERNNYIMSIYGL